MLLVLAIILILFWLVGLFTHIAGALIHLILVVAVVIFVLHFIRGRSGA
jgi:hypothetical protein